jgi:hypothetical protein
MYETPSMRELGEYILRVRGIYTERITLDMSDVSKIENKENFV